MDIVDELKKLNMEAKQHERTKRTHDKQNEKDYLLKIANTILEMKHVDAKTIELIGKSQNYTLHPKLALFYYYRLGLDPDAFIYNDEDINSPEVIARVMNAIGGAIGQNDMVRCQQSALAKDSGSGRMAACASCNEVLYHNNIVDAGPLNNLNSAFVLTKEEVSKIEALPQDLVKKHVSVYFYGGKYYHLNPDLIHTTRNIVLCNICSVNPKAHKFSLANGHDYGRKGDLRQLNGTTQNAILPARAFNIDILVRANHSTAHHIAFPSNGPVEVAKVLPRVTADTSNGIDTQVTFIGPADSWRKIQSKFRGLYSIDPEIAYSYLDVWTKLENPFFAHVIIDRSPEITKQMLAEAERIESAVIVSNDKLISDIHKQSMPTLSTPGKDSSADTESIDLESDEPFPIDKTYSVVLPKPSLMSGIDNNAVNALMKIVQPSDENMPGKDADNTVDNEEQNLTEDEQPLSECAREIESPIEKSKPIVIEREKEPLVEWDENDKIYGSVFAKLFMLGKGVPKSTMKTDQLQHCFKFYDGRFDDQLFIATAFNQMQRHTCIRKAARLSVNTRSQMASLGKLCNSNAFRKRLQWAQDNPHEPEAKKLNSYICRIVSMVSGTVPFSPFERASSRPKMKAYRFRYGPLSHFVTAAQPEFEDLTVLRHSLIDTTEWNNPCNPLTKQGFKREALPTVFRDNTSARLRLTRLRPALGAMMYKRTLDTMTEAILRCPLNETTRRSRDHTMRETGAYGKVAAISGVTEPQKEGRLHFHAGIHSSCLTPYLLTRLATAATDVVQLVGKILDSMSCTHVSQEVREWLGTVTSAEATDRPPRAADLVVPNAAIDYKGFIETGQKHAALVNHHVHGFTCEKPPKGLTRCRLSMPRGVHETETEPLMIKIHQHANLQTHQKAVLEGTPISEAMKEQINKPYEPLEGQLIRTHLDGPIIWELQRPETDKMLVESNICLNNVLRCHNNSAIITGLDTSNAVEEYYTEYMCKEGAPLKQAAAMMLAKLDDIQKYPSRADDTGTDVRTGIHLATGTCHKFVGCHEWSMPLMVYALLGSTSYITSESFRYIYPHAAVSYLKSPILPFTRTKSTNNAPDECTANAPNDTSIEDDDNDEFVDRTLHKLITGSKVNDSSNDAIGGAAAYKLWNGDVVYLSQAESYNHRGPYFEEYSYMDYECIVELKHKHKPADVTDNEPKLSSKGRDARLTFALGEDHPLYDEYEATIRCKMRLAIPAGHCIPLFPGNKPDDTDLVDDWHCKVSEFAKYVMTMLIPWRHSLPTEFNFDADGLAHMIHQFDRYDALTHNKMRYRMLLNFMQMRCRSHRNEELSSLWRDRNTDHWRDIPGHTFQKKSCQNAEGMHDNSEDSEAKGKLSASELLTLAGELADPDMVLRKQTNELVMKCTKLWNNSNSHGADVNDNSAACKVINPETYIFGATNVTSQPYEPDIHQASAPLQQQQLTYQDIIRGINTMDQKQSEDVTLAGISTYNGPMDDCIGDDIETMETDLSDLNSEQRALVATLIDTQEQHLVMMHGGGGVGKTYVITKVDTIIHNNGGRVLETCTTGVGAGNLPKGRTVDSAFKTRCKALNANSMIEQIFQSIGGDKLKLVVIDEVSMVSIGTLVQIDSRLRSMYSPTKAFGGISILLSGDFLQMPSITNGHDLYNVFYSSLKQTSTGAQAAELFRQFKVFNMSTQMRAADDPQHCLRLNEFRALPMTYPEGTRWTEAEASFRPITDAIMDQLTTPLTCEDIASDHNWLTKATCITTTNRDRAVINAIRAQLCGQVLKQKVLRWQRELCNTESIANSIKGLIYNELDHPELFAYAYIGAPAMILDNGSGNVLYGVANGTKCTIVGVAWTDDCERLAVIESINASTDTVVNLISPPDYIIVCVDGVNANTWPRELNLAPYAADGTRSEVHIPIGKHSRKNPSIRFGRTKLDYMCHAVDLALAITVWKVQGGTFDYIVMLLEPCKGSKRLTFEMLYVMFSRVKLGSRLRCMPLSHSFKRASFKQLRPDICATKWRMDIDANGFWHDCSKQCDTAIAQTPYMRHAKRSAKLNQLKTSSIVTPSPKRKLKMEAANLSTSTNIKQPRQAITMRSPAATPTQYEISSTHHDSDMNCMSLLPEGELTGHVINHFGEVLLHSAGDESDGICFFSTYIYVVYRLHNDLPTDTSAVMTRAFQHNQLWIIPINENNHWNLLVIVNGMSSNGALMIILDSCQPRGSAPRNQESVVEFGTQLIYRLRRSSSQGAPIAIQNARVTPQTNNYDCGVHVLMNVQNMIANKAAVMQLVQSGCRLQAQQWFPTSAVEPFRSHLRNTYIQ